MTVLLEIAIGLVVTFLLFSVVVSGINEWMAQMLAARGKFLRQGLQRLCNDQSIYRRVIHHPLIGSSYRERAAKGKPPSYVDARNFALAMADVLLARAGASGSERDPGRPFSVGDLRGALLAPPLSRSPIRAALMPILDRAGNDVEAALKGIETWFGAEMDRVGGWYKARTQKALFLIGFPLAVVCNFDAIEIFMALNKSPELRAEAAAVGDSLVKTGKVGDITIADLKDRPPTAAEWGSIRPAFEKMREGGGSVLPVGYACLGLAFKAADEPAPSLPSTEIKVKAGVPTDTMTKAPAPVLPSTDLKTALPSAKITKSDPWRACSAEFDRTLETRSPAAWMLKLLGWLLMAFAGTLGAVYWFDILTKAINLRGSGAKPPRPSDTPSPA